MQPKRQPTDEEFTMLEAMLCDDPAIWDAWLASQGHEPFLNLPICLAKIPPEEWLINTKIMTTPAIQKYLDSGDTLTPHTIEMMELAMESAYNVQAPWYITAVVPYFNSENGESPVMEYFYLGKE
jgi:hypothetical protein